MDPTEARTTERLASFEATTLLAVLATVMGIALWSDAGWAQEEDDVFVEPGELAEDYEPPEGLSLDRPLEVDVSFGYLEVARQGGDIVIGYQVDDTDWTQLDRANISLWIAMYIPNQAAPGTYAYSYHLPLEERTGVIEFPDWLSTLQADKVGLCVLGAMPFDNLGLGRGYVCKDLFLTGIEPELEEPDEAVVFELTYYGGMPYYGYFPWRGPFL